MTLVSHMTTMTDAMEGMQSNMEKSERKRAQRELKAVEAQIQREVRIEEIRKVDKAEAEENRRKDKEEAEKRDMIAQKKADDRTNVADNKATALQESTMTIIAQMLKLQSETNDRAAEQQRAWTVG